MNLTSVDRVRLYISNVRSDGRADDWDNNYQDAEYLAWINAVSSNIEIWLNRYVERKERTEYFNTGYNQREYFLSAYPVSAITSVQYDSTGEYTSASTATNYYVGVNENSVVLDYSLGFVRPKGLRVTYTGGLAEHPVNSIFNIDSTSGWTIGSYALSNSGALGKVVSTASGQITIANWYGVFDTEPITMYDDETTASTPAVSSTITGIKKRSLAEAYPDIARAAEVEVSYLTRRKFEFEMQDTGVENARFRGFDVTYELQPVTRNFLEKYKNICA